MSKLGFSENFRVKFFSFCFLNTPIREDDDEDNDLDDNEGSGGDVEDIKSQEEETKEENHWVELLLVFKRTNSEK